jgi:hypothetical protein
VASGDLISANDTAGIREIIARLLNTGGTHHFNANTTTGGYEQTSNLGTIPPLPQTGDVIDQTYHDSIYSGVTALCTFYDLANPYTSVDAGERINFAHYRDTYLDTRPTGIVTAFKSYSSAPWDRSADWDTTDQNETSESVSDWSGLKTQIVKVAFTDVSTMHAWLNAGGELKISLTHTHTGGSGEGYLHEEAWEELTGEIIGPQGFGEFTFSCKPNQKPFIHYQQPETRTWFKVGLDLDEQVPGIPIVQDLDSITETSDVTNSDYGSITESPVYNPLVPPFNTYSADRSLIINIDGLKTYYEVYRKRTDEGTSETDAGDYIQVSAKLDGANIYIKTEIENTQSTSLPGTTTVNIDSRRMGNSTGSIIITNPTFTITTSL